MILLPPKAYPGLFDGITSNSDPVVKEAFQIWSDRYAKGYFTDPRSHQKVRDFASGRGAMTLTGEWVIGLMTGAATKAGTTLDAFWCPT